MADNSASVLVVGLDGGTFGVLGPMMRKGILPNLARVADRGIQAELRSTIPPVTAPAWSSFMTGKNPGKHGLFGWQRPITAEYQRTWADARYIRADKLWHIIGRQGKKVGVVNVPMTYPPEQVNGFLISGMLTPSSSTNFVYPAELAAQLDALGYIVDLQILRLDRDVKSVRGKVSLLADLREVVVRRERALDELWAAGLSDFSMVVFETPDRIQHYMWDSLQHVLSGSDPEESGQVERGIVECYKEIDRAIGLLLQKGGEDSTIFVISDHGFSQLRTTVHVNDWLADLGFLAYRGGKKAVRMWARRPINLVQRCIPRAWLHRGRTAFDVLEVIDWPRTKAYLRASTDNGICINLLGREPHGIVQAGREYDALREEIKTLLTDLKDPCDGKPVMKEVLLREELYHGPYVAEAPDIVFESNEGYAASSDLSRGAVLQDVSGEGRGDHSPEGVLIAAGPQIRSGQGMTSAALIDLAPTILFALGLSIPRDMDGDVLREMFEPSFLDKSRVNYCESTPQDRAAPYERVFSLDEGDEIEDRLRGLGYL